MASSDFGLVENGPPEGILGEFDVRNSIYLGGLSAPWRQGAPAGDKGNTEGGEGSETKKNDADRDVISLTTTSCIVRTKV